MHKIRNKYANKYEEYEHPPSGFLYAECAEEKYEKNTQNTQKNIQIIRRISKKNTQHPFGIRRIVTCSYSAYSESVYVRTGTPHVADELEAVTDTDDMMATLSAPPACRSADSEIQCRNHHPTSESGKS